MRKFAFLCLLTCVACLVRGQHTEEENVKKAIQEKVDAYQRRDLDAWKNSWVHSEQISNTVTTHDGFFAIKGWDSLEAMMESDIRQNPKPDNSVKVELSNFLIHTDGNLATTEYDVTSSPAVDQSSLFPYAGVRHYHDYEVLVKDNGKWKTVTRVVTLPESYDPTSHTVEIDLNTAGYDLLGSNKVDEAIEVFRLNVKLFPDSWNTYDSLGEAYAAAGKKREAIENYEKSLQLNPNSDSGKEALSRLKQK